MASFKLMVLVFLLLVSAATARSVDPEEAREALKDSNDVTDDACQDCIHIMELLKHLMSDQQFQAKLKSVLEQLCDALPGEIQKMCHDQVEKNLPLVLTFITGLMNPKDVCTRLGLCSGQLRRQVQDLLRSHMQKTIVVPTIMLNSSIPCTICTYVVDVLDCLIPKTEALVTSLLGDVCSILPPLVQGQCTGVIKKYVKMLLDMLLDIVSPDSICASLRLCQSMDAPQRGSSLSECDSCLTLAVLTHLHLGLNASEQQAASFLRTVCQLHPDALPKCETFTQRHGNQLQGLLGKEMSALEVCEGADLCMRNDRSEPDITGDPCTLGLSYRCRDLQTAEKCGVVAFCQKNVWN